MDLAVIVILVFGAMVFSKCESGIELIQKTSYNHQSLRMVPCIRQFFKKYFNVGQAWGGSIVLFSRNPYDSLLQQQLLIFLNNNQNYDWSVMVKDKNTEINYKSRERVKNYFMFIDAAEDVLGIVTKWKSLSTWNPLAQVIVLFMKDMSLTMLESNTVNVISLLLKNNVLNVYIVSQTYNASSIQVATLFPYENDNCADRISYIRVVDNCEYDSNISFSENYGNMDMNLSSTLETKLPNNLHNCPLVASARSWEPYASYSPEYGFNKGIDVMLVKTITEKLNMDLFIVSQNGSIDQVYQELIHGDFDLIIGGIPDDPFLKDWVSSTIPYYQDDLTWCVAKAVPVLGLMNVIGMFDTLSWIAMFGFFIISTLCIYWFRLSIDKQAQAITSCLASISIVLNQPLRIRTYSSAFRLAMFGFIIFGMIFNVMYQSFLIMSLTNPILGSQVKDVQQIYELEMDVYSGVDVSRHLDKYESVYQYIRMKMQPCTDFEECIAPLNYDNRRAVAVPRSHIRYNPTIQRENIFCFSLSENIYSYLVSILTLKSYHLLEKFNRIIRLITEAGLIMKWQNELKTEIVMKEEIAKSRRDGGPKPLTFNELYGIFLIGFVGLIFSTLIFLFEHFVFKMVHRKDAHKFWTYIHVNWLMCNVKTSGRQ